MTTDAPSVTIRELIKRFGAVSALGGVSLDVHAGSCVALVGESGAGKSTLLRCINRLEEPDGGQVAVDGVPIGSRDPVTLRRAIGYVPQDGGLLPHWRVGRNAALVPWLLGAEDAPARADTALGLVGLEPQTFAHRWPHELSGGQRQRVAMARALAGDQSLLLLDEPFGALDAITRADLQRTVLHIRARRALTIMLVTHDLHEALRVADTIVVMRAGQIEQCAPGPEILRAPATPYVAELLSRAGVRNSGEA